MRLPVIAATSCLFLACGAAAQSLTQQAFPLTGSALSAAADPARSAAPPSSSPTSTSQAKRAEGTVQTGKIAWYGKRFAGRKTASGQRFDPSALTMAHPTLPFGTRVRVTNLDNGKSVIVRVNDRGPTTPGRIADLSQAAAEQIGMVRAGVADARLEVLSVMTSR